MITLSVKKRKAAYKKAIHTISKCMNDTNYVCVLLQNITYLENCASSKSFPELFLFREWSNGIAWLTHYDIWDVENHDDRSVNERKISVLQFCIEMCNDEIKSKKK